MLTLNSKFIVKSKVKIMTNEIQVLEQNSNAIIEAFKIEGGAQSLFDRIAEQARSVVPDLSTDKGRKAIASMARKVASSKTAFDAHGKELKEQYTVITSKIDADRKFFRDKCDALRDEIRKPLTDWENAEKDRVESLQARVDEISHNVQHYKKWLEEKVEYVNTVIATKYADKKEFFTSVDDDFPEDASLFKQLYNKNAESLFNNFIEKGKVSKTLYRDTLHLMGMEMTDGTEE